MRLRCIERSCSFSFMALATGRSIAGSRSDSHRAIGVLGRSANPTPATATAHGHAERDSWLAANLRNIHGGAVPRFILPSRITSLCVDRIPDRRRSNNGSQRTNERGHLCGRFREDVSSSQPLCPAPRPTLLKEQCQNRTTLPLVVLRSHRIGTHPGHRRAVDSLF